jgi:hypothetical protein
MKTSFLKFPANEQEKLIESLISISSAFKSLRFEHTKPAASPSSRSRRLRSVSNKRPRTGSDDEVEPRVQQTKKDNILSKQGNNQGQEKTYRSFPIIICHEFPKEVLENPKQLKEVISLYKTDAQIESISVLKSKDKDLGENTS